MLWLIPGIIVGFCAGILVCNKVWESDIKYKAKTTIDMCINGVFYSIRKSDRNGN